MSTVTETNKKPLLEVKGLKQYFPVSRKFTVKAVEDVSFYINPGETYGLVGESGSGKTTIGRALIRLYDPTAGQITFDGMDISGKMSRQTEARLRSDMQMIFQDPFSSLNPAKKISWILEEPLRMQKVPKEERKKALRHLLDTDMGHEKCRILKPSVLPETGIHLEVLSDYSVFLCFLSEKDTFLCIYLKETSIGQALNDYLCSLSEEESVYTKKEARQILLGLLEQL